MLLDSVLKRTITKGTLKLVSARGKPYQTFGSGAPYVILRLNSISPLSLMLAVRPDLKIAQAYQDGKLSIETGSLRDLLYILSFNYHTSKNDPFLKMLSLTNALWRKKYSDEFMKSVYGFLPEPKFRLTLLKRKWPRARNFMFSKPWLKLFHIQRSWAGIKQHLPRKGRAIVRPVVLSVTQYLINKKNAFSIALDNAQRFGIQSKSEPAAVFVAVHTQRRYYAGALKQPVNHPSLRKVVLSQPFDQRYFGSTQLYFRTNPQSARNHTLKSARIHVNANAAVLPVSKEYIMKWDRADYARSDQFVRHETS